MFALSWTLWAPNDRFPRVPFVPAFARLPAAADWMLFAIAAAGLAGSTFLKAWKPCAIAAGLALAALVLEDQHRFQPWIYQYFICMFALIYSREIEATMLCRLFFIGLYVHSGMSKLDASFVDELGGVFLGALVRPLGLSPWAWPAAARAAAILAMPAFEILIGIGLAVRPLRACAAVCAATAHLGMIEILGPWGLGHSTTVIAWNTALVVEVLVLFLPLRAADEPIAGPAEAPLRRSLREWAIVTGFAAATLVAPAFERLGWIDPWPAFALYASHGERLSVMVHDDDLPRYPAFARISASRVEGSLWYRLDLTEMSRRTRGTPLYPTIRAQLGVAEAFAKRYGGNRFVWIRIEERAGIRSSERRRRDLFGEESIRQWRGRYWLNARPAMFGSKQ